MTTTKFKHNTYTRKALNLIQDGKNVFVTGKAGTGKTFSITLEIVGDIEVKPGKDPSGCDAWIFEIKLGKIIK